MQIDQLRAFCAVYECGSFAAAARQCGVSTPTMTRYIQHMEAELNAVMLHRSTRQLTPTAAGELFYQQCKELLLQYDASLASLQTMSTQVAGTFKLGLPASINRLWVAPTLQKLCKQYPDLSVNLVIGNHLLDLLGERFDCVIHCGALPDSDLYYYKLRDWSKVTCATPRYLKNNGVPQSPDELSQHNCIDHYDSVTHCWNYLVAGKPTPVSVSGNIKANSSLDLKALALSHMGLVYLPSFTVADALAQGKLVAVLQDYQASSYDMYAVFPAKKQHNKKLQVVLAYLDEVLPY